MRFLKGEKKHCGNRSESCFLGNLSFQMVSVWECMIVITDHKCLTYLDNFKNLNSSVVCWLCIYRSEKQNLAIQALTTNNTLNAKTLQSTPTKLMLWMLDNNQILHEIRVQQQQDPICQSIVLYPQNNELPAEGKVAKRNNGVVP